MRQEILHNPDFGVIRVTFDQPGEHPVDLKQFRDEAPAPIEPLGHPTSALLGPVAEAINSATLFTLANRG